MRTLWTFGDSFTADIKDLSDNHREYLNMVKQLEIVSWPNLLAEKLNLNIKNLAIAGSSNYQIFQDFCDVSHLINEKDIVIIGWGLVSKFRKVKNNEFQNIYPNLNGVDNEIITDRNQDKWIEEIYSWENSQIIFLDNFKMNAFGEGYYEFIDKQNIVANFGGRVHYINFNEDYTHFSSTRKDDLQIVNGKLLNRTR
jgi:hypothetical protein